MVLVLFITTVVLFLAKCDEDPQKAQLLVYISENEKSFSYEILTKSCEIGLKWSESSKNTTVEVKRYPERADFLKNLIEYFTRKDNKKLFSFILINPDEFYFINLIAMNVNIGFHKTSKKLSTCANGLQLNFQEFNPENLLPYIFSFVLEYKPKKIGILLKEGKLFSTEKFTKFSATNVYTLENFEGYEISNTDLFVLAVPFHDCARNIFSVIIQTNSTFICLYEHFGEKTIERAQKEYSEINQIIKSYVKNNFPSVSEYLIQKFLNQTMVVVKRIESFEQIEAYDKENFLKSGLTLNEILYLCDLSLLARILATNSFESKLKNILKRNACGRKFFVFDNLIVPYFDIIPLSHSGRLEKPTIRESFFDSIFS